MPDNPSAVRPIEGVLLLVDLCGSTAAQARHGSEAFGKFHAGVDAALVSLEKATGFRVLERQGDGFMLFRRPAKVDDTHQELITLFSEMQRMAPSLSTPEFDCALRYVAHYSAFQAEPDADGYPRNIQSTEAVRVFRAEKLATPGDLLITHELALRLHDAPERRGCSMQTLRYDRPLKGLELLGGATTVFYRIRLPRQADALDLQFPPLYRERRRTLGEECRTIPVFGRVFDPIPMEGNFIQLRLDPVSRRIGAHDPAGTRAGSFSVLRKHDEEEDDHSDLDAADQTALHRDIRLTPEQLDIRCRHGVILGLPGAGKTTILRYLVHRALLRDATTPLLFAASGALMDAHLAHCPCDADGTGFTVRGALQLLMAVFLWPGDLVQELDPAALDRATGQFHSAWDAHEATVLLDALDEARSPELRRVLIAAARVLYNSLDHRRSLFKADAPSSRIFLTARRQFREELHLESCLIFDVEPLDLGDLSQLARSVFDPIGKRQIADRFVAELPYHPAAIKLGGTPMMALLLLFYFDNARGWTSRYATYDAVLRFVLLKVWDQAKSSDGLATLQDFFAASEGTDFREKFPAAGTLYDALSATAVRALYGDDPAPLRRLTKPDLIHFFAAWLEENHGQPGLPQPADGPGTLSARQAATWFDQLRTAALFMADEAGHFVFIHSTVLEFLAARHFVQHPAALPAALARPERQSLETLPMLCSREWQEAHRLLALLPQHVPGFTFDSFLAFSCLAETEDAESRALDEHLAEAFRGPLRQRMDGSGAKESYYEALAAILWSEDSAVLTDATERFADLLPLKRDTWPDRYLTRNGLSWAAGDLNFASEDEPSTLREARIRLLRRVLHSSLYNPFVAASLREVLAVHPEVSPATSDVAASPESEVLLTLRGHSMLAYRCAWEPSGQRLATASHDRTVIVWDVATGTALQVLRHPRAVAACAWDHVGRRIVTGADDGIVRIWDGDTGQELLSLIGHHDELDIFVCEWDPADRRIVSAGMDQTIRIWDADTGIQLRGHSGNIFACTWDPSGRRIASGDTDGLIAIWDAETERHIRVWEGHRGNVISCNWVADGQRLLSVGHDGAVCSWDVASGTKLHTSQSTEQPFWSVAWHPRNSLVALAPREARLSLWNYETGECQHRFQLPSPAHGVAWHPQGHLLAAALEDNTCVILKVPPHLV